MKKNRITIQTAPLGRETGTEEWPGEQEIQILPFGEVNTVDGRAFIVSQRSVEEISRRFEARENDLVVDYKHSTVNPLVAEAPAAGWIKALHWKLPVEGAADLPRREIGLFATVAWTDPARERLAKREYRYLSPVIELELPDPVEVNGKIILDLEAKPTAIELINAALVNDPAIDGMLPVAASELFASFTAGEDPARTAQGTPGREGGIMEELLQKLGFASAEELLAKFSELSEKSTKLAEVEGALAAANSRIEALSAELATAQEALAASQKATEVEKAVAEGIAAGRITIGEGGNSEFARKLAGENLVLFREWLSGERPETEAPRGRLKFDVRLNRETVSTDRTALAEKIAAKAKADGISLGEAYERVSLTEKPQ